MASHQGVETAPILSISELAACSHELEKAHLLAPSPLQDFQAASLKLLAEQLLLGCPGNGAVERIGLYVPGELPRQKLALKPGLLVYASQYNPGALAVANDLRTAMGDSFAVTSDPEVGLSSRATHFMLLLNNQTYLGDLGPKLADELRIIKGISREAPGIKLAMVHENDAARGGCDFGCAPACFAPPVPACRRNNYVIMS